jgi:ParB family chromosome partitioning protein
MAKPKGLGRGLDALFEQDVPGVVAQDELRVLAVSQLKPGAYQPRTRMDEAALDELADSIRAQGLMQPILVREAGAQFEIIAGERRWRAAQRAGLDEVPVLVKKVPDEAAAAMALIENIQREDLNPLEEAQGLHRLIHDFGLTHERAAQAVGRSRAAVSNLLRLMQLSAPVQELLMDGQLEMGHARALLPLPDTQQKELAYAIADRGLSVREAEKMAARLQQETRPKTQEPGRDRDIARLEEELAEKLGLPVEIRTLRRGGGSLRFHFGDLDQLDNLLKHLR